MSRYIDADALKIDLKGLGNLWKDPFDDVFGYTHGQIKSAPSIDIVRCKECKYYEAKEDWCYWRDEAITADDFCSYGERREP